MTRFASQPKLILSALALALIAIFSFVDITNSMAFAQEAAAEATTEPAASTEAAATEAAAPAEAAAEEPAPTATPEQLSQYALNSLFMFICAVLVLFMQAGFALVEVGLNSAKNAVNILAKNMLDLCIGGLLYWLVGYGLMYPGADYAGKYFGFSGSFISFDSAPDFNSTGATPWSVPADFLFQVAFAATAATIVSGAVAGRLKFPAYLIYSAVLTGLVYPISGMWKWGGGFLATEYLFQDFAGSIVVHAVGGFAGLAGAILLGPRIGRYTADGRSIPIPGHNLTFATLGVFILFVGWFGFNPGSQLQYASAPNAYATTYIAVTTFLAAIAGAVAAMLLGWIMFGKPDLTFALNGMLGGLVGITANCDRVSQFSAVTIGAIAGVLVVLGVILLDKLKIDDPVGAWPVHGLCGLWGGIATGIFGNIPDGLTRGGFITNQAISSAIIIAWAFVTMFALFALLKAIGMLRVPAEEEKMGLDVVEHGLHCYPQDPS